MSSRILKLEELSSLAQELLEKFPQGIVILRGDLAAGKTTFVQSVVRALGGSEDVTSPTFSLQQCYDKGVYHYDIYNHGLEHFLSLGMLEELEKEGLHFVEWGDEALENMLVTAGLSVVVIEIEKRSDDSREYKIDYVQA